jgi:formylglycine-generating enzyme required for sulfatase activity
MEEALAGIGRVGFVALAVSFIMGAPALADGQDTWLASRQSEFKVWQAAHPGGVAAKRLWDAPEAPRMTIVPAGEFIMGSAEGEPDRRQEEGPQHRVRIAHPFAVGTYQVTRDEYAAFVADTNHPDPESCYARDASGNAGELKGANWHNPGFAQSERDPAVCVSWEDARDYVTWLSQKTGKTYRLLSEAEFEYAARAGTQTVRYWGNGIGRGNANYGDDSDKPFAQGLDRWEYTSPGGSFPPNAFGLYDMQGNAWQRLDDCWNPTFDGAPADGSSWQTGDCTRRTGHGGGFDSQPSYLRSAFRGSVPGNSHHADGGFRVARDL